MKLFIRLVAFLTISLHLFAGGPLSKAYVTPVNLLGNDMVFDATRNVFYMSIPSAAGFPYGNSIVTIDPTSGEVTHISFIGSEPDKLAISSDGSRVYIGVDGAYSFCWWEPASDSVSALVSFTSSWPWGPYVADDFAIAPDDPHTIVVSKNDVPSSAAGDLEIFRDNISMTNMVFIYGAESITFSDAHTLIGFNSETTGFDLWKWAFNGTNLTQLADVGSVIAGFGGIKAVDGIIFSDNGRAVSASTMSALGTFSGLPGSPAVEPIAGTNVVYFLGSVSTFGSGDLQLVSFNRNMFLKTDSRTFTNITASPMRSLIAAGTDSSGSPRVGFIQRNGVAGIITMPPPRFEIERIQSNGSISQLTWSSKLGHQYHVQWSADLQNWTTFLTVTASQYDTTKTFNAQGVAQAREFYRIIED